MKDIFTNLVSNRSWDPTVPCGSGSSLEFTKLLRDTLPNFLIKHEIRSMLDAPCGDHSWMSLVEFPAGFRYIGGDIVEFMVKENQAKWPDRDFKVFDLTCDTIPDVDLLFCRDCLFHLSEADIFKVFDKVLQSNVKYIMTTSYIAGKSDNRDIKTGDFRPINLEEHPFNLPVPIDFLDDGLVDRITRRLCLWHKNDLIKSVK